MKIVIDIPDDDYEYIKTLNEGYTDYQTTLMLYRAVKNGTVKIPESITIKCNTEEDKQKLLSALRNEKSIVPVDERVHIENLDPPTICDNCIHDEVCGLEGHLEPAQTYCGWKSVKNNTVEEENSM